MWQTVTNPNGLIFNASGKRVTSGTDSSVIGKTISNLLKNAAKTLIGNEDEVALMNYLNVAAEAFLTNDERSFIPYAAVADDHGRAQGAVDHVGEEHEAEEEN